MDEQPIRPLVPRRKNLKPSSYPTQHLPPPTTTRSILKTSDPTLAAHSSPSSSHTSTSTSASSPPGSSSTKSILKPSSTARSSEAPTERTSARKLKEGAFFAFVLLPLSCWYTRGGKRLKELDDLEEEPCRPRTALRGIERRGSVGFADVAGGQQMVRRESIGVAVPMRSLGRS